jgi:hypothetical protein
MITINAENPLKDIKAFVHSWLKLLAAGRTDEAMQQIDEPNRNGDALTFNDLRVIINETFCEGTIFRQQHPGDLFISNPDELEDNGEAHLYAYDDGSEYTLEHSLPLNGEWSDLTLDFEFRKRNDRYTVALNDLHVM